MHVSLRLCVVALGLTLILAGSVAGDGVTPTGPFTGTHSEKFSLGPPGTHNQQYTIFGGFGLLSIAGGFGALAIVLYRIWVLRHLEATPMVFLMTVLFLTGVLSVLIGFLADIVIRGFYETQRKAAYYVRETDGMQGVE